MGKKTSQKKDLFKTFKEIDFSEKSFASILANVPVSALLWIFGIFRVLSAVFTGYNNPYYRVSTPELLWKLIVVVASMIYGIRIVREKKNYMSNAPLFLFPIFSVSVLTAFLRYTTSVLIIADTVIDEVMFAFVLMILGVLSASMLKEEERLITLYIIMAGGISLLRCGSDTIWLMTIEYLLMIAFLSYSLKLFDKVSKAKKEDRLKVFQKEGKIFFAILAVFLGLYMYCPHGRTAAELTNFRSLKAVSTDLFSKDDTTLSVYANARYRRPFMPMQTDEGTQFTFVDKDNQSIYSVTLMYKNEVLSFTDSKTNMSEMLELTK